MLRIVFTFVLACMVLLATAIYRSGKHTELEIPSRKQTPPLPRQKDTGTFIKTRTKETITNLAKVIHNAKKHVRGTKTSNYLQKAASMMSDILKDIDINTKGLYERFCKKSTHICPEKYKGADYGFPMFYKGFEKEKCDYSVPVFKLVTIMKYVDLKHDNLKSSLSKLKQFISSVYATFPNISTFVAADTTTPMKKLKTNYPLIKIVQSNYTSEGSALNNLLKKVKTPYVLVARNMEIMTNDSRLERLVREIESLGVVSVGGSFRYSNGHWNRGCFQSVYRNYTLKYIDGYDESFHECLFCDYVSGPFVTTAKYLKQNTFSDFNENNGLFEDWFLRVFQTGEESIVCPDSMFHVESKIKAKSEANLGEVMQKWNLYTIVASDGKTITRGCTNEKKQPSVGRPHCLLQLNTDAVTTIMRTCEENGIICEIVAGTLLGGVKMNKPLPWDVDFDIRFLLKSCSNCKQIDRALKKSGLVYYEFPSVCCKGNSEHIYFSIWYQGYYGDLIGHYEMDSDFLLKAGLAPTKVLFGGQWVNVPRNPGLYMRNRYGKEMYRHAEHYKFTGGNDFTNYTTVFLPCTEAGSHNCLDRYNADGSLQFADLLP